MSFQSSTPSRLQSRAGPPRPQHSDPAPRGNSRGRGHEDSFGGASAQASEGGSSRRSPSVASDIERLSNIPERIWHSMIRNSRDPRDTIQYYGVLSKDYSNAAQKIAQEVIQHGRRCPQHFFLEEMNCEPKDFTIAIMYYDWIIKHSKKWEEANPEVPFAPVSRERLSRTSIYWRAQAVRADGEENLFNLPEGVMRTTLDVCLIGANNLYRLLHPEQLELDRQLEQWAWNAVAAQMDRRTG